jgi:cation transport ATPase
MWLYPLLFYSLLFSSLFVLKDNKENELLEEKLLQQQTQQSQQSQQPRQARKRWKTDKEHLFTNNLVSGAMLAIFLVIIQAFIQIGLHNLCSYVVVISLAISGPCFAASIFTNSKEVKYPYKRSAIIVNTIYGFGILFGFLGLVTTFWYISWIIGIVFLGASLLVFVFSLLYVKQLSQDEEGKYMWR